MIGRKVACALLMCGAVLAGSLATAQSFVMSVQSASGLIGTDVDSAVLLDNPVGAVQGWSFGVCHNGAAVSLVDVVAGATTLTVMNGAPPSFITFNDMPFGGTGYTMGVVIDFFGVVSLGVGTGYELSVATYNLTTLGTSNLQLCDTLGNPPVETLVVVGGGSNTPVQNNGTLEAIDVPPLAIEFAAGSATVQFDAMGDTVSQGVVGIRMDNDDPSAEVQGYSFGLTHDASKLTLAAINLTGTVTALTNGGAGPDFFSPGLNPVGGTGGTVGVVVSLTPPFESIAPGVDQLIANFVYGAGPTAADGDTVALTFTDQLGNPPVALVAVVNGNTVIPTSVPGSVTLEFLNVVVNSYLRGDANADGIVNIADGIWILNFLWLGGPASPCQAAEDANGDGVGDTSDALYIFMWQLQPGSPSPMFPAPVGNFPGCDVADQALCASSTPSCP